MWLDKKMNVPEGWISVTLKKPHCIMFIAFMVTWKFYLKK